MNYINGKWEFTEGEKKFHELNMKIIQNRKPMIYNFGEFKSPLRNAKKRTDEEESDAHLEEE